MKKLTTFQLNLLSNFKSPSQSIEVQLLSDSRNRPPQFLKAEYQRIPFFTEHRNHYTPNVANRLIADYFLNRKVDVDSPEMIKPILNLPVNDVVVRHDEPRFCETAKSELTWVGNMNQDMQKWYTACEPFKLAFIGHIKSLPSKIKTENFLKTISPLIPRVQSESYLILVKEQLGY